MNIRNDKREVWAQMIMLWILQNYYGYTADERVLPFMKRYFEWEMAQPDEVFLKDYWENCRGGDNIWSVVWSLAFATADNGVAYTVYGPNRATLDVGAPNAKEVTITEDTHYPFSDTLRFAISAKEKVEFPLYFRIPSWTKNATVRVNGKKTGNPEPGTYLKIAGEWKDGDTVELVFPMELTVRRWPVNRNSASVDYGPLTLSLMIDERYEKRNSAEVAIGDSQWQAGADTDKWPTYEIYPDSPWNYSLVLPESNDLSGFKVEQLPWPADDQPFTVENVPLRVSAKGRLIPSWGIDETGLTGVLPRPDAKRSENVDDITLVPMGAARLRISAFPTSEK